MDQREYLGTHNKRGSLGETKRKTTWGPQDLACRALPVEVSEPLRIPNWIFTAATLGMFKDVILSAVNTQEVLKLFF